jgi:hypothetical protein
MITCENNLSVFNCIVVLIKDCNRDDHKAGGFEIIRKTAFFQSLGLV